MSDHSKLRELADKVLDEDRGYTEDGYADNALVLMNRGAARDLANAVIALTERCDRLSRQEVYVVDLAREQLAAKDAEIERLESEIDRLNARIGGLT